MPLGSRRTHANEVFNPGVARMSPRSARRAQHFTESRYYVPGYALLYTRTIEKPPPSNFRMNPTHSACTIVSITRNDSTKNSHQTVYFQLKGSYFFISNFKYQWTLSTHFFLSIYTRQPFMCNTLLRTQNN